MLEETIKLEALRQKIEKIEESMGSQSDYIDYGRPDKKQIEKIQKEIASDKIKADAMKAELGELISKTSSQALDEWVNWHKSILQKIVSEQGTDTKSKTRIFTARQTLEAWEKVLRKEQDYILINRYYLKDYKEIAKKEFRKDWWKFWK
jgi:hypothetical protein